MNVSDSSGKRGNNKLELKQEGWFSSIRSKASSVFGRSVQWSPDAKIYFKKEDTGLEDTGLTAKDIRSYLLESRQTGGRGPSAEKRELIEQFIHELSAEYNFSPLAEGIFLSLFLHSGDEQLSYRIAKKVEEKYPNPSNVREVVGDFESSLSAVWKYPDNYSILQTMLSNPQYDELFIEILKDGSLESVVNLISFKNNPALLTLLLDLSKSSERVDLYRAFMEIKDGGKTHALEELDKENSELFKAFQDSQNDEFFINLFKGGKIYNVLLAFSNPKLLQILLNLSKSSERVDLYRAFMEMDGYDKSQVLNALDDNPRLLNAFEDPQNDKFFINTFKGETPTGVICVLKYNPGLLQVVFKLSKPSERENLYSAFEKMDDHEKFYILEALGKSRRLFHAFEDPQNDKFFIKLFKKSGLVIVDELEKNPESLQVLLDLSKTSERENLYTAFEDLTGNDKASVLKALGENRELREAFQDPQNDEFFIDFFQGEGELDSIISAFEKNPESLQVFLKLLKAPSERDDLYMAFKAMDDYSKNKTLKVLSENRELLEAFKSPENDEFFINLFKSDKMIDITLVFEKNPALLSVLLELSKNVDGKGLLATLLGLRDVGSILRELNDNPKLLDAMTYPSNQRVFKAIFSAANPLIIIGNFKKSTFSIRAIFEGLQKIEDPQHLDTIFNSPGLLQIFLDTQYQDFFTKIFLRDDADDILVPLGRRPELLRILKALSRIQQDDATFAGRFFNLPLGQNYFSSAYSRLSRLKMSINSLKDLDLTKIDSQVTFISIFAYASAEQVSTLMWLSSNQKLSKAFADDSYQSIFHSIFERKLLEFFKKNAILSEKLTDPQYRQYFESILKEEKSLEILNVIARHPNAFLSLKLEDVKRLLELNNEDLDTILSSIRLQEKYFPDKKIDLPQYLSSLSNLQNVINTLPEDIVEHPQNVLMIKAILLMVQQSAPGLSDEIQKKLKLTDLPITERFKEVAVLLYSQLNSSVNINQLLKDPTIDKWDILDLQQEDIDDKQWEAIKENIIDLASLLYPANTVSEESGLRMDNIKSFLANAMNISGTESNNAEERYEGIQRVRKRIARILDFLKPDSTDEKFKRLEVIKNQLQNGEKNPELLSEKGLLEKDVKEKLLKNNQKLIHTIYDRLDVGGTKCPDRVLVLLERAEIDIQMANHPEFLPNILVRLFKRNAIETQLVNPNNAESIEQYLYFVIHLRRFLGLESEKKPEQTMLHGPIGAAMYNAIGDAQTIFRVFKAFTREDLIGFVADDPVFRDIVDNRSNEAVNKIIDSMVKLEFYQNKMLVVDDIDNEKYFNEELDKALQNELLEVLCSPEDKELAQDSSELMRIFTESYSNPKYNNILNTWYAHVKKLQSEALYKKSAEKLLEDAGFLKPIEK